MLTAAHKTFLQSLFPGQAALFEPEETHVFACDASRLKGSTESLAVVRPESGEQIVELLDWAQTERVNIYPRGRATNVVGACVPVSTAGGGVVVSLLNMGQVVDIREDDFVAEVQPGVLTGDLQKQLAAKGLFYPPDPASAAISTIGGNISTGAGGLRAVKYGVTRDYVLGLTAVLPGGKVLTTGTRCHKNVVGLDLTRLFVGSEGSLGIVTRAVLKLLPLPKASGTVLAAYGSLEDALQAARDIFAAGLLPTAMEFMDAVTATAVANQHGQAPWDDSAKAVLLVQVDGSPDNVARDVAIVADVLGQHGPACLETAQGEDEERLWELRRSINPASYTLGPDKMSDDVTVPRGQVGRAVGAIHGLAAKRGLRIMVFGHLGDGNLHVNIMHDGGNEDERANAAVAKAEVLKLVLDMGGTLSGEHGVGLTKLSHVGNQLTPLERELMAGVKAAFDPHGIMNPGKGFSSSS